MAAVQIIRNEESYMKGKSLGVTEAAQQPMAPAPFLVAEGGNGTGSNAMPPKAVI